MLIIFSCFSSLATAQDISERISSQLQKSPAFETGFVGLAVYDPLEGEMLYEFNAQKHFVPASNVKLLTYYVAQKTLRDSVPGLTYVIRNDSLVFSGTGDPSFLNPVLPDSGILNFLKGRTEKLFYSPRSVSEERLGSGWSWDDYYYSFSAERSEFPIYGNQAEFLLVPGRKEQTVLPEFFKDSLRLTPSEKAEIRRQQESNIFQYSYGDRRRIIKKRVPFRTSNELLVRLLSDTLQKPVELLPAGPQFLPQEVILSLPSDTLYKRMLQESDNLIAEQLLMMVGQQIADTLRTDAAINLSKKMFLENLPNEVIWVDGSGLSRYNLTTPSNMIHILEKLREEVGYPRLLQLLPAGGKSGTLKHHYRASRPYIFAKSGSMSNSYSLSGYLIARSGKIFIFSFMNNNFTVPTSLVRNGMEQILQEIRNNH